MNYFRLKLNRALELKERLLRELLPARMRVNSLSDGLNNEILAMTATPSEHARYLRRVVRDAAFGARYKVLFGDIYQLAAATLPSFDFVTLFHLAEFAAPDPARRLDDVGLLTLFLAKLSAHGRLLFYSNSSGRRATERILAHYEARQALVLEEKFRSLLIYRAGRGDSR